jgi:hypothetical protein
MNEDEDGLTFRDETPDPEGVPPVLDNPQTIPQVVPGAMGFGDARLEYAVYTRYADAAEPPPLTKTDFDRAFSESSGGNLFQKGVITDYVTMQTLIRSDNENMDRVRDAVDMRDLVVQLLRSATSLTNFQWQQIDNRLEQQLDERERRARREGDRAELAEIRQERAALRQFETIRETQGADAAMAYVQNTAAGDLVAQAVDNTLQPEPTSVTPDMGGAWGSTAMPQTVIASNSPLQSSFGGAVTSDGDRVETGDGYSPGRRGQEFNA